MTKEEALELLAAFNARLESQGRCVDGRLLDKANNLKRQIDAGEFDKENEE